MSSELNQCDDQEEESAADLRATPELPNILPEIASGNGESNCNEIKSEPPDNGASDEMVETQIPANNEALGTPAVEKDKRVNEEIDYNMPIGKTPLNENEQNCDLNAKLGNSSSKEDQTENRSNVDASSAKITLNEYIDGLATPLMPRLRVKSELELQQAPPSQQLPGSGDPMDAENIAPPPPSFFSSNSNSNFVADGIATPRLSIASTNRLRVKTEFSFPPQTTKDNEADSLPILPECDFTDLMDIGIPRKESGEVSPSISGDDSEDENIPENFFDDLLHDKLKERIQLAQNNELEEKYSDRLKEYERLNNELKAKEKHKKSKKQKKSKKKSRKRSRSPSLSPSSKTKERSHKNLANNDRNKRSRVSPSFTEIPSSSNRAHRDVIDDTFLRMDAGFKVKSEFPANDLKNTANDDESALLIDSVQEIEEVLTPMQKREKAVQRASNLLKYIKEETSDNSNNIFSKFLFVSTVRKLPTSHSYVQQQIYENRSPLHTVNNVSYRFNSHTTRFNMEEWGLAVLSPNAAKIAKLVGCSADFIHNKLKTIKIPANLKKVKQEPNKENESDQEEETVTETASSLYSNAMTQTDDISEFGMSRKEKGYEIGVQVEPSVYSIGCQTLETQSPTENIHKDDEAPIMKIIHDLNENQLMAIHAFAELIREPNASANAMEMYKIQMKILDIYKMSQIPSALVTVQPPIVNNYTTKARNQPPICIKSVSGADGMKFSINDPRSRSAAYTRRTSNEDSSSNYDSRYSASHPSNSRYSGHERFSPTSHSSRSSGSGSSRHYSNHSPSQQRQNSPPYAAKHYGRGSLRR